jgi:hypothetical protein
MSKPDSIQKAEILTRYFGIYGKGNFDLDQWDVSMIIGYLESDWDEERLNLALRALYEELEKQRMG